MANEVLFGGAWFFNPASGNVYMGDGRLGPAWLETESFPSHGGTAAVEKYVFSKVRDKERIREAAYLDASSGKPRLVRRIYDLDGRVVIGTFDYVADGVFKLLGAQNREKMGQEIADEINGAPQPFGKEE